MGKPRSSNKHLPRRMYEKHGGFYYVDKANTWHKLKGDYSDALKQYASLIDDSRDDLIGGLIARYIREVLPKRADETAKGRKKEFKALLPKFKDTPAKKLRASDAWTYFEQRGSNQAARHEVSALSAVMGWAVKWGKVDSNPLLSVGFPTFRPRDRYVTDEEFVAVRDCAHFMIAYAMNIALITAARQKQIRLLDRKQVAAGLLKTTHSKTGKKVNYPVAGSLAENIEAALRHAPQVRQYVIVNRNGKPYTLDGFQTQWKRAINKALKLKLIETPFTFHDIKAKSLSDAETLEEARQRAAHSDARITQQVYRRKPEIVTVQDISHLKSAKAEKPV